MIVTNYRRKDVIIAETVDTAPIEAPETLKKDASVESRGTAEVAIKKGGAKK